MFDVLTATSTQFTFLLQGYVTPISITTSMTTGSAPDNITVAGPWTGTAVNHILTFTVGTIGTPDAFSWALDGGSPSSPVNMTVCPTTATITGGITACWTASTGHVSGNVWTTTVYEGAGADSGTASASMGLLKVEPQCTSPLCRIEWDTWKMEGLTLTGPSDHINTMAGVILNCLSSPYSQFGKSQIHNNVFAGQSGGYSIYLDNQVNHEGCWIISDIVDNSIYSGV